MNLSFSRSGEIQWPLEIVQAAAEEKHCMENEEGRGKTEKKQEESRKTFEKQVKRTKRGRKTDLQPGSAWKTGC